MFLQFRIVQTDGTERHQLLCLHQQRCQGHETSLFFSLTLGSFLRMLYLHFKSQQIGFEEPKSPFCSSLNLKHAEYEIYEVRICRKHIGSENRFMEFAQPVI